MQVHYEGKLYLGLRIQLFDGAVVEWDGRRMKHFTTVTRVGAGNMVNGYFFSPSRRIVDEKYRTPFVRNPRMT